MPTKILAIDDSKTMRLAIKITFAAEDVEVVAVSRGSEAVARARQMSPDIILVDAKLASGEPEGYEVCRALKSDEATNGIPVLVMVSNQAGIDEARLGECGADGAIIKPFDTTELIETVGKTVGKPVAKPAAAVAARPAPAPAPAPAARPTPAPAPAAKPAAAARAPSRPTSAPAAAAKPAARPAPSTPTPAARPPSGPRPQAAPGAPADIPIAIPIPFVPAGSPTPGILKRLEEAGGGAAAGLDPKAVQALLELSRDVIEQVVWEVVPDLAEHIIKENQAKSA